MNENHQTARETIVIDTRGQVCPSTLLVTLQHLNTHKKALKKGMAVLKVMSDNRHSTVTIPDTVRNMGYEVLVNREAGHYEILVGRDLEQP